MPEKLKKIIEEAWKDRSLLNEVATREAIHSLIDLLDKGKIRVAEPAGDKWKVNEWVKKGVNTPMRPTNFRALAEASAFGIY